MSMLVKASIERRLIDLATKNDPVSKAKHSAGLVLKGRLIATGTNKRKTHPIMAKYGRNSEAVYLHAELDCITKALREYGPEVVAASDLYVARVLKSGDWSNSCPCEGCRRAINAFRIQKVYYTTQRGWEVFIPDWRSSVV